MTFASENALYNQMIDYLQREYTLLLEGDTTLSLSALVQEKRLLLQQFTLLPPLDAPSMQTIAQMLERNASVLRGRIDGLQAVIDILRQGEESGVYGPDGTQASCAPQRATFFETV